jgi:hypothetical protein
MSLDDLFLSRQHYATYLGRLFNSGAQQEGSDAHGRLLLLIAQWVGATYRNLEFLV